MYVIFVKPSFETDNFKKNILGEHIKTLVYGDSSSYSRFIIVKILQFLNEILHSNSISENQLQNNAITFKIKLNESLAWF